MKIGEKQRPMLAQTPYSVYVVSYAPCQALSFKARSRFRAQSRV